jgi:BirA family biotin operon repressor/biotin-[acetyl-CoA-carboxylase] ligase
MKKDEFRSAIQVFDVLASTQESILGVGDGDAPEGTTHIARTQTEGRGRSRRSWWSPPNAGLWMSVLLRPRRERASWGGLALVAGRGVKEALCDLGVPGVELFWPNDLQVRGRKIGGILGESRARGGKAWLALGIGVNVDLSPPGIAGKMPPQLRGRITSMVESGRPTTVDPVEIARAILRRFWPLYGEFVGGTEVPAIVAGHLAHAGCPVRVLTRGVKAWVGVVEGLGGGGELLVRPLGALSPAQAAPGGDWLRDRPGVVAVTGGEVVYEAPPAP